MQAAPGPLNGSLLLWRHAEAQDPVPGRIADADRALTPRGHEQAARMAAWLLPQLSGPCRVLASPAARTRQTAAALQQPYQTDERVGLAATPHSVLAAAAWPGAPGVTVIVGHQPTLGETAALLLPDLDAEWNMARGAMLWITRVLHEGAMRNRLHLAMTPEAVRAPHKGQGI